MQSKLIIIPVEKMEKTKIDLVKSFKTPGIYVSLNKSVKGLKQLFEKNKISFSKIFFIDCINSNTNPNILSIFPTQLDKLEYAIKVFINEIKGRKFLIIDALSTLLIYNNENKVASFVKEIINYSQKHEVEFVALSPKTKGEELLNKIFDFFDVVKGK